MKKLNNKIITLALICLTLFSFSALAEKHTYKGQVEGMVCAFCTYNVCKKIAQFEGVDATTVNLDLKSGEVGFISSVPVEQSELAKLFSDTGFKLVSLNEVKSSQLSALKFNDKALISLSFAAKQLSEFGDILDALGTLAASQTTQLTLTSPKNKEVDILKPIIAGRQRAIKVNYKTSDSNEVNIKLSTIL